MASGKFYAYSPAIVLFSESYDEGWNAYLDGKKIPTVIGNYNFIACSVGPGQHEITFKYEPRVFWLSLYISILGLVVFIAGAAFSGFWRRKDKQGKV